MQKNITKFMGLLTLTSLIFLSCSSTDDDPASIKEWAGSDPHFQVAGTLNNEHLDLAVDEDKTTDLTVLRCRREYEIPLKDGSTTELDYDNGNLVEIKIDAVLKVDGESRYVELELKEHDFSKGPKELIIIPRTDDAVPAENELFVEWEWYHTDDFKSDEDAYYEEAAQSGTVIIEQFDGTPADNGLTLEDYTGTVGIYIKAKWSETESLTISSTANCYKNKISDP
jgi:hypothetical protein